MFGVGGTSGCNFNLILFSLIIFILLPVPFSQAHGGQKRTEPPSLFLKVAASLWPFLLMVHSFPVWLHPPCDKQYFDVFTLTYGFLR